MAPRRSLPNPTLASLIRTLALLTGTALALSACSGLDPFDGEEGSGIPDTAIYATSSNVDLDTFTDADPDGPAATDLVVLDGDFDQIEVSSVFEVTILIEDGPTTVEVTVDDNLIDDLDVHVDDEELHIGFEDGSYDLAVTPTALVRVPSLAALDLSGAAHASAGPIDADNIRLELSGIAVAVLAGTTDSLVIDASGASRAELADLRVDSAEVNLSGIARVELDGASTIRGELSGAAELQAPDDAIDRIETSGIARIEPD